ncbi:phosphohexomutase domain-containing protein [Wenzhouxiangella sp. EGI_FJ10409]|uniref:hypothetical protein n=1 Tax=Wenzhouxiangella sp. EGI_FJ10409 TaxID=3243767 RepID=UPI0035E2AE05
MNASQSFLTRDSVANLIRLTSLVAIALGLFAIVTGGVAVYLNLSAQLELERSDRAATQQADRIATELADVQTALRDASVVDAARAGSGDALRAALRTRGVTSILDARLLPAEIDAVATSEEIDLGFAAIEVVLEAIRNDRAEIRVLEPGTPSESLAFAQRMPGEGDVLLLRLTVNVLTSLMHDHEALDFLALAQSDRRDRTVLTAVGRSAAARIREIPIADSSLLLQWSRATVSAPIDNRAAVIVGSSGIIVLMLGLLLRRRTRLARYLGETEAGAQRPEPRRAKAAGKAAAPARRPDPQAAPRGKDHADDPMARDWRSAEDEPPTMVAPAPDLPEWLREDVDAGLDELGDEDLGTTMPTPDAPLSDPGSDDDEALLEDFDTYQGVDPSLFRPDGIYGKAGEELGVPDMVILGQAIGSQAADEGLRRICVAHDDRASGGELLEGLSRGLSVSGIDVIDLGKAPAPLAWFAAMRRQQAGAVVISGGNRPQDINGLEIVLDGRWLDREERRGLLDRIRNQEFATGAGEHEITDEAERYGEQLAASHRLQRPLRVVVDCGNPVNGAFAPGLFESLGVDVIALNADAETRPEQVAAFDSAERGQDLQLCVENFAADLGLAFDGTGGKLRVVDPGGQPVSTARLAALLAADLAEQSEEPSVVADAGLAAQLALPGSAEDIRIIACDGDARAVQRSLRERNSGLGVHSDGSIMTAGDWHGLPDAFHAAAWLLAVLAADGRPVAEILSTGQKDADPAARD